MLRSSRLLRSTLGLSFARGVSGLLLVAATVVLARGAGKEELGLFGLALVVGMYASVVADTGVSQYLVPGLARRRRDEWPDAWADVMRFQRLSAVPYAVVYAVLVSLLTHGEMRWTLLAALPWWLLIRLNGTMRSVFVAAGSVTAEATATVAESAVTLAVLAVVVAAHPSAPLAVLALSAGAVVGLAIRHAGLRSLGLSGGRAHSPVRSLVREALPFNAFTVLTNLYLRIDVILLSILASERALALYQPPIRFAVALMIVPDALASLLLGRSARAPGDRGLHARQEQLLALGFPLGLALVVGAALFGKPLLGALYGADFRHAAAALTLMTATVPLALLSTMNGNALTARGRQRTRLVCLGVAAVVAVACGIPAIDRWSYTGAAAVSLLNEVTLAAGYALALWLTVGRDGILLPRFAQSR
jgi:O-antigen/teichoic acid export membrane protein